MFIVDKDKIKYYEKAYYQNYEPIPFETKCGYILNIYPSTVKEWTLFEDSVSILTQDKSKTNDPNIISMSYLEFLYNLIGAEAIEQKGTTCKDMLFNVLKITFKDENNSTFTFKWYNDRVNLCLVDSSNVVKCKITPKEFNNIIDIILTYNIIDYDDRTFSDDIIKAIEDYRKLRYKNTHSPSLEMRKAFVISKTGLDYKYVNEMPYRLFDLIFECNLGVDSYIGDKIIQGSEKFRVDENIVHPLYQPKRDILSEVFSDSQEFKDKLSEVAKA
jgi:hypothetical protein